MEKKFFDQPINSDTKRYKETRQLTTGQGEDYTAWSLLDYDYIKKSLQTNCSWFKQANRIRCWSKTIQHIEFLGKLRNPEYESIYNESMFVLTFLEKIKEATLK